MILNVKKALSQNYTSDHYSGFSVVIAAKNEAANIPRLISALSNIDYPESFFEVIIVDDNSEDNTCQLTEDLIKDFQNFSIIRAEDKNLPGKKGALEAGLSKAKHDFIMITDADCVPSSGWLKAFNNYLPQQPGILFGIAPLFQKKNLVNHISCFENLRSSLLTLSLTKAGLPYTAAARNFGFSRKVFNNIGGYKQTLQTLGGDDDLLIRQGVIHNVKIIPVTEQNSEVFSESKASFKEYFVQKSRHLKTSAYYLLKQKLALGYWHLLNLFFIFSPVLVLINTWFISFFIIKIIYDEIVVLLYQKRFGYSFSVFRIFYLQILYEVLLVVNFILSRIRKDRWK
ncbi:MAG: glycosyltransferase [Ignavibacteriaceae bacterium]